MLILLAPYVQSFATLPKVGELRSPPVYVASTFDGEIPLLSEANLMKKGVIDMARSNDYPRGLENIRYLLSMFEKANDESSRNELLQVIEDSIRSFTNLAFSKPHRGRTARRRVNTGLEALELQLSSGVLPAPYDEVPRHTFLVALRALSATIATDADRKELNPRSSISTDVAFRILQRLLTGVGVRDASGRQQPISERDFNSVLNAVANVGRMDVAHKVVALQERTPRAPRLTAVTYSILLKGYGRLGDIENVEMILEKANKNGVEPDTIMLNSILDALVNCKEVGKAKSVFKQFVTEAGSASPNVRTYNTMLKGFALEGSLDEAKRLTNQMRARNIWDAVTTNTLVSVAVKANNFEFAEVVLANHTLAATDSSPERGHRLRRDHPNIEAYTSLLDGYAKSGDLEKALGTLQRMRRVRVQPNEYTYTCVISALAKKRKIRQAIRLLDYMEASGTMPTAVTYNAFMSALVRVNKIAVNTNEEYLSDGEDPWYVEQAIELLRRMVTKGVRPTVSTISILLECLATCSRPRIGEATAIVERFERNGIIPINNAKVNTAMIRVYGAAKDIKGALEVFRRIEKPDIIAVNAFLDASCRTGEMKIAFDTFDHLFSQQSSTLDKITPDVITFSILISSQLRLNTVRAAKKAQGLYQDMRIRRIQPDILLVDKILSAMTRDGRLVLQKKDIQFTLQVLRDAESLPWKEGELEQLKQAVRGVMIGRMSEVWNENKDYYGINAVAEDELFKKKGWNKVDSGFRLWGGDGDSISYADDKPSAEPIDEFLASKGWNDIERHSGFRLF